MPKPQQLIPLVQRLFKCYDRAIAIRLEKPTKSGDSIGEAMWRIKGPELDAANDEMDDLVDAIESRWQSVAGAPPPKLWRSRAELRAHFRNPKKVEDAKLALTELRDSLVSQLRQKRRIPDLRFDEVKQQVTRLDGEFEPVVLPDESLVMLRKIYDDGPIALKALTQIKVGKGIVTFVPQQVYKRVHSINAKIKASLGIVIANDQQLYAVALQRHRE